jgi:hypothetical protein
MVSIRPGVAAEIIFEGDEAEQRIPCPQTMICSVEEKRILLSQPAPPISATRRGNRLLVTFLEADEGISIRYGFWGRLKGFKDYELTPSQRISVLVVERETEPKKYNLRENFRIKPPPNQGLTAFSQGLWFTIVDISVGGVRISTKKDLPFKVHDLIKVTIGVDNTNFDVEGRVVKAWSARMAGGVGHQSCASIQFLNNQAARESLLGRKIILLEREMLARGVQ